MLSEYHRHIGRRHLDVGPGTGYFLERTQLSPDASITLLDPNPNVLAHTSRRLTHLDTTTVEADVLQPLGHLGPYHSIALNYVLHCLPGPMSRKAVAVQNLASALRSEGVLFGATVLGRPKLHTHLSRVVLRWNNRQGIFDNLADTEDELRQILEAC